MTAYCQQGKPGSLRERVYERDGRRCVECGSTEKLTLDHKVPQSRGGKRTFENLQTMCATCNNRKGSRSTVPRPGVRDRRRGRRVRGPSPAVPATVAFSDLHPSVQSMLWR